MGENNAGFHVLTTSIKALPQIFWIVVTGKDVGDETRFRNIRLLP